MRIRAQHALFALSAAAILCGMTVATVYAGLGEIHRDPKATLSKGNDYLPYCDLLIDPVGQYIHDKFRYGDKWTKLGAFNCDSLIRLGCLEMPGICFPNY